MERYPCPRSNRSRPKPLHLGSRLSLHRQTAHLRITCPPRRDILHRLQHNPPLTTRTTHSRHPRSHRQHRPRLRRLPPSKISLTELRKRSLNAPRFNKAYKNHAERAFLSLFPSPRALAFCFDAGFTASIIRNSGTRSKSAK